MLSMIRRNLPKNHCLQTPDNHDSTNFSQLNVLTRGANRFVGGGIDTATLDNYFNNPEMSSLQAAWRSFKEGQYHQAVQAFEAFVSASGYHQKLKVNETLSMHEVSVFTPEQQKQYYATYIASMVLGDMYFMLGQLPKAKDAYQNAISLIAFYDIIEANIDSQEALLTAAGNLTYLSNQILGEINRLQRFSTIPNASGGAIQTLNGCSSDFVSPPSAYTSTYTSSLSLVPDFNLMVLMEVESRCKGQGKGTGF